jgi:L-alanine-DL-glutamate epimerase-like enolase superfamily enzyme
MRIKDISTTILSSRSIDESASDSSQDDIIVEVLTDEGLVGIGEVDAAPTVIKALIDMPSSHDRSQGFKGLLIGEDPLQIEKLWNKLYQRTIAVGRRGVGIMAIGAVDMALWDLAGKYYDKPVWKLLGGAQREAVVPYASLPPLQNPLDIEYEALRLKIDYVKKSGFRAAKIEELVNSEPRDYRIVEEARKMLGIEIELMVDAYYCWPDFETALKRCAGLEKFNLFFIETPLPVDDLVGLGKLSRALTTRIAAGERNTTLYEFVDLIDRGGVDVAQPDIGRVGGLTEAKKVAEYARTRGVMTIPHCWRTGIGIAAEVHFSASTPNCPYIEFLTRELAKSPLRRELTNEFEIKDGYIDLPEEPGLGIELNQSVIEKYKVDTLK